ncbi:hypothetical protein [Chitinilyticum piscinae]|uniref:Uncharacterized protein n=1 Tax=Chitinilyticum piscinae TaxID=2866724 RepID=A0A8J7K117_9NEIS|nr:hypothetical protein [Chitinilyticum piscinae]MBE9607972.1 hypothetical protein [Chitinilyticum piscinae]
MWNTIKQLWNRPDPLAGVDLALIEQLVELASPKIRLASRYKERLAPYLGWAEAQATATAAHLPAPVMLTSESWRQDRLLQLVFATPQRMHEVINQHGILAQWFYDWPLADSLCTLLVVTPHEQTRYGVSEQDGQLRQDVPQRLLTFRDHRLGRAVESPAALQALLPLQILDMVAGEARRSIELLEAEKTQLEDELGNARVMLRLASTSTPEAAADKARQEERIRSLTTELERSHQALNPDALCDILETQLAATPDLLQMSCREYRVNGLGMIDSEDGDALPLHLTEYTLARTPPIVRVLIPVLIQRQQIDAREDDAGGFSPAAL